MTAGKDRNQQPGEARVVVGPLEVLSEKELEGITGGAAPAGNLGSQEGGEDKAFNEHGSPSGLALASPFEEPIFIARDRNGILTVW